MSPATDAHRVTGSTSTVTRATPTNVTAVAGSRRRARRA